MARNLFALDLLGVCKPIVVYDKNGLYLTRNTPSRTRRTISAATDHRATNGVNKVIIEPTNKDNPNTLVPPNL